MDNRVKELLEGGGIDVTGLLSRCMGSEALGAKLLKKFPADASFARLSAAMTADDFTAAVEAAHTLKGVCGNLSLSALFPLLEKQVALLRFGDNAGAAALMPDIERAYARALHAIEEGLA